MGQRQHGESWYDYVERQIDDERLTIRRNQIHKQLGCASCRGFALGKCDLVERYLQDKEPTAHGAYANRRVDVDTRETCAMRKEVYSLI
ncbi:hypothetical protein FWF74_00110 [Candidatus Saccharibacteria bacterium]|nr:hypothetical protein [Candidatus Saccharibacteria bacterium]MCL1962834.1 hypothetical protein [Candidatus Saccharibacteria bacterium]